MRRSTALPRRRQGTPARSSRVAAPLRRVRDRPVAARAGRSPPRRRSPSARALSSKHFPTSAVLKPPAGTNPLLYTSPSMPEQPCAFHPDRLTGVSCSRCGRPICPEDMYPAPVGQHCPICAGKMREGPLGRTGYRVRTRTERIPAARFLQGAQVTTLIVIANLIVFTLMLLAGSLTSAHTLRSFGALTNPLPASQWWRLVTAMFVHLGFAHIALNMLALILFGGAIE